MFEYKTTVKVKGDDGNEYDRDVTLQFKPYGDAPGKISRYNQNNIERQLWLTMEWGLISPAHWPDDSVLPGHRLFDDMSQRDISDCYTKWQEHNDDEDKEG
jgi:hypothetical protein